MDRLNAGNRLPDGGRLLVVATRRNVPNKGIDGGRIHVPYANGSRFFAPLTDSVVPNRSMGPITFSRATAATVIDNEGIIRYAKSGEARFQGARRVENLFAYSQELTNAAWTVGGITRALHTETINGIPTYSLLTETINGIPTYSLLDDATTAVHRTYQAQTFVSGNTYIASYYLKQNTLAYAQIYLSGVSNDYANFDLSTGTVSAGTAGAGSISSLGNGWYRCSLKFTTTSGGSNAVNLITINSSTSSRAQSYLGTGVGYYASVAQLEDVTGQSIQTVGDYVSTNVLSSPFHGAMVDGVKYFDTDISGNQLSPDGYLAEGGRTNLFTDSEDFSLWTKAGTGVITTNATIAPDGRMTADLLTLSTSNEGQSVNKTITTTASIYGYSVYVKPNGHNYVQLLASAGINSGYMNFDLLNGVVGTSSSYTGRVEALPNGWYRLKVTTPTVVAATGTFIIAAVPSASASRGGFVTGTGTSGVYLWGAVLELGASSSYISSALVTRNDDILEYQLRNLESRQGAVYAETTNYFTSTNTAVLGLTGSSCRVLGSSGTSPGFYYGSGTQVVSNDGTSNLTSSNSVSSSQYNRVIWKYSGVAHELCVNGTLTSGAFDGTTSYTNLCIGNSTANTRGLYGSIRNLQIWDYEISDAEAVALTTI